MWNTINALMILQIRHEKNCHVEHAWEWTTLQHATALEGMVQNPNFHKCGILV